MEKLELKFKFGQKVWSIQDNEIQELEISRIDFSHYYSDIKKEFTQIMYGLGYGYVDDYQDVLFKNIKEDKIFSTKEELLNQYI
ncbi:hypothetical protein HXZ94_15725 [Empedobacter falsenii]|uniref:hypothetical protein n=1 Tax=Empedobacter falsenii TaxID=343874 RepID=UPI0025779473|nr:hypothetical protein [Empedobacter falsenii]MDM1299944.1 hypothetical protein [Empedobacter falsenii]MDM1319737.1 hypothetical protein [Empedobacter falsenii]